MILDILRAFDIIKLLGKVTGLGAYLKPEYEKDRAAIRANTLINVMLRLDFNPLITIEKQAVLLQEELCPEGFEYREDFLQESEMRLNDPIERDNRNFPKKLENERVYRFVQDDKVFSFSRFFLIYQASPFSKNFVADIERFSDLILKVKRSSPYINIKRLGIRKTNLVIATDFVQLFNCFRSDCLPVSAVNKVSVGEFGVFESQEKFFSSELQLACNIHKRIDSGEIQLTNDNGSYFDQKDVLRFILELETYSRGEKALTNSTDYVKKLIQMNAVVFFLYLEHLTPDFLCHLKLKKTDDLLSGVKPNG